MLTKSILGLLVVCGIVAGVAFSRTDSTPAAAPKSCCIECTCTPEACASGDCDSSCCEEKSCCTEGCCGETTAPAASKEGCTEGSCCSSKA